MIVYFNGNVYTEENTTYSQRNVTDHVLFHVCIDERGITRVPLCVRVRETKGIVKKIKEKERYNNVTAFDSCKYITYTKYVDVCIYIYMFVKVYVCI